MKFRRVIEILEENGFVWHRRNATSHRLYRKVELNGTVRIVTVAYHLISDEVLPKTLASMIRQSGLSKKLFR